MHCRELKQDFSNVSKTMINTLSFFNKIEMAHWGGDAIPHILPVLNEKNDELY